MRPALQGPLSLLAQGLAHLGLGLDWGSLVQEDLDDPHVAIPGSTVQRGELILEAQRNACVQR